jgi:hypothetical protein
MHDHEVLMDGYTCTGMTIFTDAWARANECLLRGLAVVFDRVCGVPWGRSVCPTRRR